MQFRRISSFILIVLILSSAGLWMSCDKNDKNSDNGSGNPVTPGAGENWPAELPEFTHGQLIQIVAAEESGEFGGATFANISNPETSFQNYHTVLLNAGWTLDSDTSNEESWQRSYSKGEMQLLVTVAKDGAFAQLLLFGI